VRHTRHHIDFILEEVGFFFYCLEYSLGQTPKCKARCRFYRIYWSAGWISHVENSRQFQFSASRVARPVESNRRLVTRASFATDVRSLGTEFSLARGLARRFARRAPPRRPTTMVHITEDEPDSSLASPRDAEAHKLEGNRAFGEGRFEDAERLYTRALDALPSEASGRGDLSADGSEIEEDDASEGTDETTTLNDTEERDDGCSETTIDLNGVVVTEDGPGARARARALGTRKKNRKRAVYFANRAACRLRLHRPSEAVNDCTDSIRCDPSFLKARMRRAEARQAMDPPDLEGALADYESVAAAPSSSGTAASEYDADFFRKAETSAARLRPIVEQRREDLKKEMMDKLKGLGDALLGNFGLSTKNFKAEKDDAGAYSVRFVQNP